ncbi:MAG TPA: acyl-ACP thioesterase domain-containing protein [Opitutus sp.]|nr:acyl-ACP thioesterase domain-containing protein [Opitutus sp.]
MTDKFILNSVVTYAGVDRDEVLTLAGVFKLLQDAAIAHANQFDAGTRAMLTRGESWVLNRIAVEIVRYPRYEEAVRVETWSNGIRGFKGIRDFRGYDGRGEQWLRGSSLWLYVNARTKTIVRVPPEIAAGFPTHTAELFCPDLEKLEFDAPAETAPRIEVTLRYADFDANAHVNNAAYLDFVQTALARAGFPARPRGVRVKYAKGIAAETAAIDVRVERVADGARFGVEKDGTVYAVGETL